MASNLLSKLSPELLDKIIAYADNAEEKTMIHKLQSGTAHPLDCLASVSSGLRRHVEEYSRHELAKRTKLRVTKVDSKRIQYRKRWIRYQAIHCHFCNRKTNRRAMFDEKTVCCLACDRAKYPKITMTQALSSPHLTKLDLFTPNELHPSLPPLKVAIYKCMGADATMLLEEEVKARETYIAGLGITKSATASKARKRRHTRAMALMGRMVHLGRWIQQDHDLSSFAGAEMSSHQRGVCIDELLAVDRAAIAKAEKE